MNVSESNALNILLRWLAKPDASDASADRAAEAAKLLAERAHKTLGHGLSGPDAERVVLVEQDRRTETAEDLDAALVVCEALEVHTSRGGAIPWPSIARPFKAWQEAQRS